jgi:hypothetical protein
VRARCVTSSNVDGLSNLTYAEYPGLDHHFANSAGESRLSELEAKASAWMAATGLVF